MRAGSVKTVRIRDSPIRADSGSLSPPTPGTSSEGKSIFVVKMREMYKAMPSEELETKIEQLWNGLTPAQRQQFLKTGEKENVSQKQSVPIKISKVPVLERRNNCKAIAKVLDLKASKTTKLSYPELVKNRMKLYQKECFAVSSRNYPPSPPRPMAPSSSSSDSFKPSFLTPKLPSRLLKIVQQRRKSMENSSTPVEKAPMKCNFSISFKSTATKPVTRSHLVAKSRKPTAETVKLPVLMISYDEACQKYYQTLSQASLVHSVDTTMLSSYANIMEGWQMVKEYKFGQQL